MNKASLHGVWLAAWMRGMFVAFITAAMGLHAFAADDIPAAPEQYFNDYAHVTTDSVAKQLDLQLAQFEKDTGCRIIVAVFPKMESDASVEDYTRRIGKAWKAELKVKDKGLLLAVFVKDHQICLQSGADYEKIVPDAMCKKIIDAEILPYFKTYDFNSGLASGIKAMIAAARGEYKGMEATPAAPAPAEGK